MGSGKFDPHLFFQSADNVALHVAGEELFGFLSRSLDLPAAWAAMVRRSTGDHAVVRAGEVIDGTDADDVLFVRTTPLDVTIEEDQLASRDGFQCRAIIKLRLRVIPERGELVSFTDKLLGSHRVVQTQRVADYLRAAVRGAVAALAADHDAEWLVDSRSNAEATSAVARALEAPCFAAGLSVDSAPSVCFDSVSVRAVQRHQDDSARRRAEHDSRRSLQVAVEHAQAQHIDHLTSLLGRLEELAAASPDADMPELMRTFSEHQRGELYGALFAAESPIYRTRWIVVSVGEELLFFDPDATERPARRVTIDDAVGPVRSVQVADAGGSAPTLWLGAATGIYRFPVDGSAADLTLPVDGSPRVRGGFNAVAIADHRVIATHSELGICEWDVKSENPSRRRFESMTQNSKAIRGAALYNGHFHCSVDDRIFCWPADNDSDRPTRIYTGSEATITAIAPTAQGLFGGNSHGDILFWPTGNYSDPQRLHRGSNRAAESLWLVETGGLPRLVYADTSLHVHARVCGDTFVCHYEAGGQTLRRVEVADDLFVATNDLRDRLICWSPGRPDRPRDTIGVGAMCGRSVQDVCLVPAPSA